MRVLLTAPPGTGKSTVIETVVSQFKGPSQGIVAREILDDSGKRIGFTSVNASGASRQFMYYTDKPTKDSVGGEFNVDIESIDAFVVPELARGLKNGKSLTYIDEIGRAQAKSDSFISTLKALLKADTNILGAIVYDDEPWSIQFKQDPTVCLLEITTGNRNALPDILLKAFENASMFAALADAQQRKAYQLLQEFVASGQYIAAQKIFTNALPYVADRKIKLEEKKGSTQQFLVSGQTHEHRVFWDKASGLFSCDCDLSNGQGIYEGQPQVCSHQVSILLMN